MRGWATGKTLAVWLGYRAGIHGERNGPTSSFWWDAAAEALMDEKRNSNCSSFMLRSSFRTENTPRMRSTSRRRDETVSGVSDVFAVSAGSSAAAVCVPSAIVAGSRWRRGSLGTLRECSAVEFARYSAGTV